jgi:hypothetical protein
MDKLEKVIKGLRALELMAELDGIQKEFEDDEEFKEFCKKSGGSKEEPEKEEVDTKEDAEEDIDKFFSEKCSLKVEIEGKENGSSVGVSYEGCKSKADMILMGVAVMSSIVDNLDDHEEKVETLAKICTLALTGKSAGIHKVMEVGNRIGD